jgi:hypothetical protein
MWTSGHNGHVRRAAHGCEAAREDAMKAFAKSWRRDLKVAGSRPARSDVETCAAQRRAALRQRA